MKRRTSAPPPGHPLTEAQFRSGKTVTNDYAVRAEYAWDTGEAIGHFLAGLKEGVIRGRLCAKCGAVVVPPRTFCEWCFRPNDEWVNLKDTGTVVTYSISFVNWDASRRKVPQVPAVIAIDGASPGVGILHLLDRVGKTVDEINAKVKIGMPVKAVWKSAKERTGAITDIVAFVPRRSK